MGTEKKVFTGDATQLEAVYARVVAAQDRLDQKSQQLADNSVKKSKHWADGLNSVNGAVDKGVGSVQSLAQQWLSVGAIIAGATAEAEEFNQVQQSVADTMASIGQSQSKLMFNLANVSPAERKQFLAGIDKIQKDFQIPDVRSLYAAGDKALSATGGNVDIALETLRDAAPLGRNTPEELAEISLGAATIQEVAGVNAKQALAFQSSVGGPAFISDPAQQARYIPAALKGGMETVAKENRDTQDEIKREMQFMGATFAALGNVAGDTEGMSTRTEFLDLAGELEDFYTKGVEVTLPGTSIKTKRKPKVDPGTLEGRVRHLQQNEKDRKAFLDQTTNQEQFRIARRELFNVDGVTARTLDKALPQISFDTAQYDAMVESQTSATPEIRQANRAAEIEASEQQRRRDELVAIGASAKKIRNEALKQTRQYGGPVYGTRMINDYFAEYMQTELGNDPVDSAISDVEYRRRRMLQPGSLLGGRDSLARARDVDSLSPQERKDYEFLGQELQRLRALQEQQQELQRLQLEETKRQTEAIQGQDRPTVNPRAAIGVHSER